MAKDKETTLQCILPACELFLTHRSEATAAFSTETLYRIKFTHFSFERESQMPFMSAFSARKIQVLNFQFKETRKVERISNITVAVMTEIQVMSWITGPQS